MGIVDREMPQLHAQKTFVLKARKHSAYRFNGKPQVVGNVKAGHAEVKLVWREASGQQSVGEIEKESR